MISANHVDGLELRIKEIAAQRDNALAQNAELVAQVEALRSGLIDARKWIDERNHVCDKSKDFCDTLTLLIEATPAQCLLDVKAEAVMSFASFVYEQFEKGDYHRIARGKHHKLNSRAQGQTVSIHNDAEYCGILGNAEFYAERIIKGEL